jgi:hypothetical protein
VNTAESPVTTNRSPFALLREAEEAEEVLLLTYTANLGFFERFALGEARGLQARTTVLSDAGMVTSDPATVRGAGIRYADARAVCPGRTAFHPKLLAIAGRQSATVCVGSGNLTLAGWHGNEEIWTILHADEQRGPSTLHEVARFLRTLASSPIRLSAEAPEALTRTAGLLEALPASEPGPTLASTLEGRIVDRLPDGPVDELLVYAPFHDAELAALEAIHARLQPMTTAVYVQPQTSVNGERLHRWLAEHDAELRWCSGERYRHGKLIEWSRDGVREALTGSPNLSHRALLTGITTGHGPPANLELAIISRLDSSMAPPTAQPPSDGLGVLTLSNDPAEAPRSGILLLGATLINGSELELRLADPPQARTRLQIHDPERDWTSVPGVGELASGSRTYLLPVVGLAPGSAVRLFGANGASNEVFITDPIRIRRRPLQRIGPESGTPVEQLLDGKLEVLYQIAELLRPALLKHGAMVPKPQPSNGTAGDDKPEDRDNQPVRPAEGQSLSDYLEACAAVLDETTVAWALMLPGLPGLGENPTSDSGELTNATDDEAADAGREDTEIPPVDLATALQRAKKFRRDQFRRFSRGVLERLTSWPNLMRAYGARLVLCGTAADLWPDDAERGEVLVGLVQALCAPGDEPTPEEQAALAAYIAVALAMLRADVRKLSVNDEPTLRFKQAANVSRAMLRELDPALIDAATEELRGALGHLASAENILAIAADITVRGSGVAAAIALLREEDNIDAHEDDGTLVVDDPLPQVPELQLLRMIGMVGGPGPAKVTGTTEAGVATFCIWQAPLLVVAKRAKGRLSGRIYRIPNSHPATLAAGWQPGVGVSENLPKPAGEWYAGGTPPADAVELLQAGGVLPVPTPDTWPLSGQAKPAS